MNIYIYEKKKIFNIVFKGTIWSLRIRHRFQSNNETLSAADCRQWLFKFVLVISLIVNVVTVLILILFLIQLVLIIKRKFSPKYTVIYA